ncbi:MAG TPA: hypothetical protein VIM30_08010 [Candidatus Limnocylindrales bacterium]
MLISSRVPRSGTYDRSTKEGKAAARVTISLPTDVADYLRSRAEELKEPVSGFVADTIRWRQTLEIERAMVEGLLEDADQDLELVSEWAATLPELPD